MNVGFCPKCPFHGRPLSLLTSKASKGLVREPGPGTVLSTRQPPLRCLLSWKPTRRDCNQGPPPALSGFDGFGQGEALAGHQRWGGDRGDSEAFLLPPCSPWSSRQWPRFVVAAPAGWPLSWTPAATGVTEFPPLVSSNGGVLEGLPAGLRPLSGLTPLISSPYHTHCGKQSFQ